MNSKHKSEVHILILLRSKRTHYSVNVEYSRLCRVAGPSVRPDQRGFTLFQNRQEIWDIEFCKKKNVFESYTISLNLNIFFCLVSQTDQSIYLPIYYSIILLKQL